MAMKITHVQVWVHDQDEALDWYTNKLGFEVRSDVTMAELGDFRWLAVGPPGQPEVAVTLMAVPGAPVFDDATATAIKELVSKGAATGIFLQTDDLDGVYEELKGRGVEIVDEPTERPYGKDMGFRDPSGNQMRMMQQPA
jgi:catechol 2,3-dioxygenase-like lactoylglutathione lyase family enzyme